jgi:hypothetical protein
MSVLLQIDAFANVTSVSDAELQDSVFTTRVSNSSPARITYE